MLKNINRFLEDEGYKKLDLLEDYIYEWKGLWHTWMVKSKTTLPFLVLRKSWP